MFSRALPDAAARLAVSRINKDPYLSQGYWFDYLLLNEDCQTSRALSGFLKSESYASGFVGPLNPGYCAAAGLMGKNWNKPVVSWACMSPELDGEGGEAYPTFSRPLPLSSRVLFAVLKHFHWAHAAIVTAEQDLWVETGQELASSLRRFGLPVSAVVTMETDPAGAEAALKRVGRAHKVRVIIMCMHSALLGGEEQRLLLERRGTCAWRTAATCSSPSTRCTTACLTGTRPTHCSATTASCAAPYDSVLTVTVESGDKSFTQAFREAQDSHEVQASYQASQVGYWLTHPSWGQLVKALEPKRWSA
ncbi:hypothetical protein AOXY_G30283 [Acipenser oxyrinchus oxyrinchus]|uniref:Receptor ligand binding region domain-containing protein n=1 Tax=Acipenser oxyrinchus oxyrinchus TaxID=40147 RepID=A0AAD8CNB5_ACIOX|nr:hypothetical protein AOXY_G30283 [Acipenser oxyrinchus oxyrinchus]